MLEDLSRSSSVRGHLFLRRSSMRLLERKIVEVSIGRNTTRKIFIVSSAITKNLFRTPDTNQMSCIINLNLAEELLVDQKLLKNTPEVLKNTIF